MRSFLHQSHDVYIRHRTLNILDLAVVQRNFIFTVAVAEAETIFREIFALQFMGSFLPNVLFYIQTTVASREAKRC